MDCPIDQNTLVMGERAGLEISYCPVCRGIWLDRGQLDTIIERSVANAPTPPPGPGANDGYGASPGNGGFDIRDILGGRRGHDGRRGGFLVGHHR